VSARTGYAVQSYYTDKMDALLHFSYNEETDLAQGVVADTDQLSIPLADIDPEGQQTKQTGYEELMDEAEVMYPERAKLSAECQANLRRFEAKHNIPEDARLTSKHGRLSYVQIDGATWYYEDE